MMKQNIKKSVAASLLVLLATQLSGCNASAGIKPSQATCNQFLTQMQAHQFGAAYGLLSSKCKAVTTAQQMQNYWDLVNKNRGKVQSWTQQGFQVYSGTGGSSVQLGYALKCANGSSGVNFTCVDENGKWLIQGFNFSG
jgi:hypothetical protein